MNRENLQRAYEIKRQIGNQCLSMIGAKYENIGETNNNPYYSFRIGRNPGKIGIIKIELLCTDVYKMIFFDSQAGILDTLEDIYSEDLARIIKEKTGIEVKL